MSSPPDFHDALAEHALIALGEVPEDEGTLFLIGPDEPRFWDVFSASDEYADGAPDPLDRWSMRVLAPLAQRFGGEALFPFGGPPWHPFYTWAVGTGRFWPSPIGFLVHTERGLFASFRGAIRLSVPAERDTTAPKPCVSCHAPCATACPVDAFADGYDVAACKSHITSPAGADCMIEGCRARRACPVGQGLRPAAQSQFHMEAFA